MKLGLESHITGRGHLLRQALLEVIEAMGNLASVHEHISTSSLEGAIAAIDATSDALRRAASNLRQARGQAPS